MIFKLHNSENPDACLSSAISWARHCCCVPSFGTHYLRSEFKTNLSGVGHTIFILL